MALKAKVFLRRAEREDLDTVVSWMEDPEFQRFLYGDPTRSPKQTRQQIVSMLGRTSNRTMPQGIHFIIDTDKYGPVGMHSIVNIGWRNRSCNVDSYVIKKVRSSFISTFSFCRTIDYCFSVLNMRRINLFVYSFNPRSWRIIERTGAKRELTLKQHVARDGEIFDMYGYALFPEDWEKLHEELTRHIAGLDLATMIAEYKARGKAAGEAP